MAEHLLQLPIVSEDEDNICLPLVITAISRYWGQDIPVVEAKEVARRYPKVKGTIMMEGIELAEKHGLKSYIYRGSLLDIQKRIGQGLPLIVILPGIQETVQHATIISGYDDSSNRVLTYIPEADKIGAITYKQFNQLWLQDDNTTMILVPSDMSEVLERDRPLFTHSNRLCFVAEKLNLQGRYDEAVAELRRAQQADPKNPRPWSQLGTLFNERNNDEAVNCYKEALKLNSHYYLAYRGLGNFYIKKKDYQKAEEYYSQAITINPFRFGPIYKNRALARIELRNNKGAGDDFATYLEQCPDAPDKNDVKEMIKELVQK